MNRTYLPWMGWGWVLSAVVLSAAEAVQPDAASAPTALERIVLSADGAGFVGTESGAPFIVWGVNYDHDRDGRLLEDYWGPDAAVVEEDFLEIQALGANVVRIHLQLGRFMAAPDRVDSGALERLGWLLRLAEETGLYLNLTGLGCYHLGDVPAWYDPMEEAERWEVQAAFWRGVAEACASSPAVFCYDLMNEPVVGGGGDDNPGWLAGEFGGKHFVQRIALDLAGRTREQVADAWTRKLTEAIRLHDPDRLITVGVIPWAHVWPNAKPLFHAPPAGDHLDFVSVHFYPKQGEVDKALTALAVYDLGKPLVVEEMFPLHCSQDELVDFIDGSRTLAEGWISFYWGVTPEEYAARTNDLAAAITGAWLERFSGLATRMKSPIRDGDGAEGLEDVQGKDRVVNGGF